jgi:2-polyprenyl-3-methyl-5-hydroxy-6-metoxy-1,4-benzoquinol methylase
MAIVATNRHVVLLDAIRELARYREEDPTATAFNVGNSFYTVNEAWRAAAPKTAAEIMGHYRTCEAQVEQQVFATYGIPSEVALRDRICSMVGPEASVLDFGAGIGSQLMPLVARGCRCTHVDVGGVMMAYAFWRYSRIPPTPGRVRESRLNDVSLVELKDDYMEVGIPELQGRRFDVVICTEVLEHVIDPERLVSLLSSLVKPGGLCVATTSFHDDGTIPMHLNIDKYSDESFLKVFKQNGLIQSSDHFFTRK